MNQLSTAKKNVVKRHKFFPKAIKEITPELLIWSIHSSYFSKRRWGEYISLYLTFFNDHSEAKIKAQTHSLVLMCRSLRNNCGCSFDKMYKAVVEEIEHSGIEISSEVLRMDSKYDFKNSILNDLADEGSFS